MTELSELESLRHCNAELRLEVANLTAERDHYKALVEATSHPLPRRLTEEELANTTLKPIQPCGLGDPVLRGLVNLALSVTTGPIKLDDQRELGVVNWRPVANLDDVVRVQIDAIVYVPYPKDRK